MARKKRCPVCANIVENGSCTNPTCQYKEG